MNISNIKADKVNIGNVVTGTVYGDVVAGDKIITSIYEAPPPPLPPAEAHDRRNLSILLSRVKTFWIKGVLGKSVHQMALIDLGKETQAEAVSHAWEQVLELPDQSQQTIPPDKKIGQVFDEMNRAMLILGEPGSGKTITLLQLAQELIVQTEADETFTQPVPVVFNLSSWTDKEQPLIDWMVMELTAKYQIPKRISRPWLENNRLLPLLDGLDEVKVENQAACVQAINHFGEEFGLAGLVVCSRTKEYASLPVRLKLNGAIRLQSLTLEQINDYLARASSKLDALRSILQTDKGLQQMAQSPLILGIMTLAYQGMSIEVLSSQVFDTVETRRKHLFDIFIEEMFRRKGKRKKPYTKQETVFWLAWLAVNMKKHSLSIFLIENLGTGWLSDAQCHKLRRIGGFLAGVPVFLLFVFLCGVASLQEPHWYSSWVGWMRGLFIVLGGLLSGIGFGWINNRYFGDYIPHEEIIVWSHKKIAPVLLEKLRDGVALGAGFGIQFGLGSGLGLILASAYNLALPQYQSFLETYGFIPIRTMLNLTGRFNAILIVGTLVGLSIALLFKSGCARIFYGVISGGAVILLLAVLKIQAFLGINGEFTDTFITWLLFIFVSVLVCVISGLSISLLIAFPYGLIDGIFKGFQSSIEFQAKTTVPNQGIHQLAKNGLLKGLFMGLIAGLSIGIFFFPLIGITMIYANGFGLVELADGYYNRIGSGVVGGFALGLLGGLIAGFWKYGGYSVLQHYAIRFILYREGHIPRDYSKFLNHCAELIFLQKVGGGYIFIHQFLLEHFAKMNIEGKQFK